jgi:cysteine-rich repeat protein
MSHRTMRNLIGAFFHRWSGAQRGVFRVASLAAAWAAALAFVVFGTRAFAQDVISFEATAYPVAANAKGFSAGDCDGDGIDDLIAAGQNANQVTILLNDGTGIFHFGGTVDVGTQPTGAACGDFNGDGLIDVAAVSRDAGTVRFYRREENGTFTFYGSRPAGLLPTSLTGANLNGDNKLDLIAVGSRSDDVTILLGTGSAALPPFSSIRVPMESPHSAAVGDFNLDGNPDIVVAGSGTPFVVILIGDGSSFAPLPDSVPSPFAETQRPPKATGVAAADINQDGKPDLAVLSDDSIFLYLGDGNGHFSFLEDFGSSPEGQAVVLDDLNFDGLMDLAILHSSTNSAEILLATGPARFPNLVHASSTGRAVTNGFRIADTRTRLLDPTDPDSTQLQLVAVDAAPPGIALVRQDNLAALSVTSLRALPSPPLAVVLTDLTGDQIKDAVVSIKARGRALPLEILAGDANGGYSPLPIIGPSTCGNGIIEGAELCDDGNAKGHDGCSKTCQPELKGPLASLDSADMDGDGINDLVVVDKSSVLALLLSDAQGRFRDVRTLLKVGRHTGATVGDFNGDGVADILVIPKGRRDGALLLLVNDGFGSFLQTSIFSDQRVSGPVLAADVDNNGFPDAIVGLRRGGWQVLLNDGGGPSRPGALVSAPKHLLGFAAADFDEDGWLDILATFKASRRTPSALLYKGAVAGDYASDSRIAVDSALANPYVVDIDQDRHQDIVTCDSVTAPFCRVLYGNGTGEFAATALPNDTSIGRDVRGAGAADFDGDGVVDLVGISRRDNRGKILFRHADRVTTDEAILTTGMKPAALAVIDLDRNGLPDIVVANEGSNDLSVFMSHGQHDYPTPATIRLPTGGLGAPAIAVGDINGDLYPDIAVTQAGSHTVTPFFNLGGVLAAVGPLQTGTEPRGVALGNLNGDGTLDIVTANRGADTISVLLSQPDGTYVRQDYPSGGLRPSAVSLTDLNGDQLDDVVVTNEKIVNNLRTGNVVVFLNDGTATFTTPSSVHVRGRETPRAVCAGDFDADGNQDIAVASIDSNDVMILHGNGTGTWRSDEQCFPVGEQAVSVWCYDADGDGRADVAFGRKLAGDVGAILSGE